VENPEQAPRKSIHLFDLDDTLIQTTARVLVLGPDGGLLRALAPSEFTHYRPALGETFDFREFSDLGILSRGIVVRYTKSIIDTILRYGTRSHFGILTARSDKKLHAPFLIRFFRSLFGVRLAKEHIFAVSDSRFATYKDRGPGGRPGPFASLSVAQRKALVIAEDLVGRGFNDISFYDDSRENLDSFKVLREAYPHVVYKPHFIDPTWRARIREFLESGAERKCLIKGIGSVRIILEHHSHYGSFQEPALSALQDGLAVPLATCPLWLKLRDGRYYLERSQEGIPRADTAATEEPDAQADAS
jgi:hypothetical protein